MKIGLITKNKIKINSKLQGTSTLHLKVQIIKTRNHHLGCNNLCKFHFIARLTVKINSHMTIKI